MKLHTYILTDQPTVCPICGARTNFVDLNKYTQHHNCPCCNYEFFAEED